MNGRPLRLLVVDDHPLVRMGVVRLARRAGFEVVGEAASVSSSVALAAELRPDVVLMDLRLPDGSGIEACREIRARSSLTRVVMLTSYPDEDAVLGAVEAGASGYLLKQIRGRDLISALDAVGRGKSLLDPALSRQVVQRMREVASGGEVGEIGMLTPQERRIVELVADGKTNKEIAAVVFLSDKTVKNYVSNILSKLGLQHRAQVAAFAVRHRLMQTADARGT